MVGEVVTHFKEAAACWDGPPRSLVDDVAPCPEKMSDTKKHSKFQILILPSCRPSSNNYLPQERSIPSVRRTRKRVTGGHWRVFQGAAAQGLGLHVAAVGGHRALCTEGPRIFRHLGLTPRAWSHDPVPPFVFSRSIVFSRPRITIMIDDRLYGDVL